MKRLLCPICYAHIISSALLVSNFKRNIFSASQFGKNFQKKDQQIVRFGTDTMSYNSADICVDQCFPSLCWYYRIAHRIICEKFCLLYFMSMSRNPIFWLLKATRWFYVALYGLCCATHILYQPICKNFKEFCTI